MASSRTPLATTGDPRERPLELGKIQNLRVAVRSLDRIVVPAGEVFSFWRQVGPCRRGRGFVNGRQLQEGCLVPAVGGGICQLSNALYDVALKAGLEVVERHPHTRLVPGSAAQNDRDATVAWNHIDLRWRAGQTTRLRAYLTSSELVVELWSASARAQGAQPTRLLRQIVDPAAHSCGTCEQVDCHLFEKGVLATSDREAVLVDEVWPEFDGWASSSSATLFLPVNGLALRRPAYAWDTAGYGSVVQAVLPTLRRAWRSRRLAEQGAARQEARIRSAQELAEAYGRRLGHDVTHVTVTLELLPHLWRAGVLGGRTFDVLMTRHPMAEVHARLDAALAQHPERKLLGDYRAPDWLVEFEAEALLAARNLITPHRDVVKDDPRRVLLDWKASGPWPGNPPTAVKFLVFPGPTAGRKGAHEVREAARCLGLPVLALGSNLEGPDFWDGVIMLPRDSGWADQACAVVQPAILEDRPRTLLRALAAGRPVICTAACGLIGLPGVSEVPAGDTDALILAIKACM